ncbi:MAG: hypothetical protein H6815_03735 [Phycisphaeraceae bacterium]|nr:hypothetical protein [Phycisphaeraceae bacterium]
MKLRIRPVRAIVCLVLGAMTTVLVAWIVAYVQPFNRIFPETVAGVQRDAYMLKEGRWIGRYSWDLWYRTTRRSFWAWPISRPVPPDSAAWEFFTVAELNRSGSEFPIVPVTSADTFLLTTPDDAQMFFSAATDRIGMPLQALEMKVRYSKTAYIGVESVSAVRFRWTHFNIDVMFPTRIVTGGFVFDTIFFGVMEYLLSLAPEKFVRWNRRRRGRCVYCCYDRAGLGDNHACPECGRI